MARLDAVAQNWRLSFARRIYGLRMMHRLPTHCGVVSKPHAHRAGVMPLVSC
jgi:hypothetical protein